MDGLSHKNPDLVLKLKKNGVDIFSGRNSRLSRESEETPLQSSSILQRKKSFRLRDLTTSDASVEEKMSDSGLDEAVAEQSGIDPVT